MRPIPFLRMSPKVDVLARYADFLRRKNIPVVCCPIYRSWVPSFFALCHSVFLHHVLSSMRWLCLPKLQNRLYLKKNVNKLVLYRVPNQRFRSGSGLRNVGSGISLSVLGTPRVFPGMNATLKSDKIQPPESFYFIFTLEFFQNISF